MRVESRKAWPVHRGKSALIVALAGLWGAAALLQARPTRPRLLPAEQRFRLLETGSGGRLGVVALDTGTGDTIAYRADERFAMCSTFKLPLVACVLARVDAGKESLSREIPFGKEDMLEWAPVTEAHLARRHMTVGALCQAAIEVSDNTAANLLIGIVGGPEQLTRWLRGIGDEVTRLDRREPELNANDPGDPRDTTTPAAMVETVRRILLGDVLSPASKERLIGWLKACKTGRARLRAGVPARWEEGDKTGTGRRGAANDVAVFWPPGRKPILVAAYFSGSPKSPEERDAVLAKVGHIVAEEFGGK